MAVRPIGLRPACDAHRAALPAPAIHIPVGSGGQAQEPRGELAALGDGHRDQMRPDLNFERSQIHTLRAQAIVRRKRINRKPYKCASPQDRIGRTDNVP